MPGGAPPGRISSPPGPDGSAGALIDNVPLTAAGLFRAFTSVVPPHDMASAASRADPAVRVLHRADIPASFRRVLHVWREQSVS